MLPYQLLTTCLSKRRLPTKATNKPIGSPPSRTPPSGNSKPTTSRSSKRSPSATKTYNTPSGPSSKPYKFTTTILNNLQICPFTHTITYKKPDESSKMPNQTSQHAASEIFGENFGSLLENSPKYLQTNPPYLPPPPTTSATSSTTSSLPTTKPSHKPTSSVIWKTSYCRESSLYTPRCRKTPHNHFPALTHSLHLLENSPKFSPHLPKVSQPLKHFPNSYALVLENTTLHCAIHYILCSYFIILHTLYARFLSATLFNFSNFKKITQCHSSSFYTTQLLY